MVKVLAERHAARVIMCEQRSQAMPDEVCTWERPLRLGSSLLGRLTPAEQSVRRHFTAWFLYFRETFYLRENKNDSQFARDLGISRSVVSSVLSGKPVGLDVALKMRAVFKRTLDDLALRAPERAPPIPSSASSSAGDPTKRRRERGGP
jgi:transcriptional regulator with XRE-family HTH domain